MRQVNLNNKKDILLLFIYTPGISSEINEPILGRTRFTKLLFIFWKEGLKYFKQSSNLGDQMFYSFIPWNFGPFSQQIYDDLTFFQLRNFIELENAKSDNEGISYQEYNHWAETTGVDYGTGNLYQNDYIEQLVKLSPKGIEYVTPLYNSLSESQKTLLKNYKAKFNSTPLRAILRYVYQTYPEYASNSKIRSNILGNSYD